MRQELADCCLACFEEQVQQHQQRANKAVRGDGEISSMDDWSGGPSPEGRDAYAPDCASRAAEGFYVGALYGALFLSVVDEAQPANVSTTSQHLEYACTYGTYLL